MNGGLVGHTMQDRPLIGSVHVKNKHSQGIYIAVSFDNSKKEKHPKITKKSLATSAELNIRHFRILRKKATNLRMRAQIKKVPQIVELLKKKPVGLQHFKPTSSVCVLGEKDAVEAAPCAHAASRAHSLDAMPGPANWPLVGSFVELMRKGGLTRQHEALVG